MWWFWTFCCPSFCLAPNFNQKLSNFDFKLCNRYSRERKNRFEPINSTMNNDTCNYYNLPTFMYENNDKFFEIRDLTECAQHNALYVCPTSNVLRTESRFQRLDVSCSYHRKNCDYHYSYKVSTVGVLIRNNLNYDTFAVNSSGWTIM